MIKTLTTVRCDRCGKKVYSELGVKEEVKKTFKGLGWAFPFKNSDVCYCNKCVKEMEDGEK